VTAARFFNLSRRKGVQGSNTDFLICAVAVRHRLAIFSTDKDFAQYAKYLPIVLHRQTRVEQVAQADSAECHAALRLRRLARVLDTVQHPPSPGRQP